MYVQFCRHCFPHIPLFSNQQLFSEETATSEINGCTACPKSPSKAGFPKVLDINEKSFVREMTTVHWSLDVNVILFICNLIPVHD